MKKLKEMPKTYLAIIITIIVTVLLTWILPVTYYNVTNLVSDGTRSQVGIFDLFSYGSVSLSYFGNLALYVLVIGAFYGLLHKTRGYQKLIDKIASKFDTKCKKIVILSIFVVVMAILTSICGASMGLLIFVPFIISIVLAMGYDKITAAIVTVGSIAVGLMGTILSSTYIAGDYDVTAQNAGGILNSLAETTYKSMIWPKIIILILGIAAILVYLFIYIKIKGNTNEQINKKNENKVQKSEEISSHDSSHIIIAIILGLLFIIIMLALTSWTSVFNVKCFNTVTNYILNEFTIFKFPIFGKLLGEIKPFEQWGTDELIQLITFATGIMTIVALATKVSIKDIISGIKEGITKALKPAIMIILIYMVLVIVSYNPIVLTITKHLFGMCKNHVNIFGMTLGAFITYIFNVDMYYSANTTLPYVLQITEASGHAKELIAYIWQTMYGFSTLVAPTSLILMSILSYLGISYGTWIKKTIFMILAILGLCVISSLVIMFVI